MLCCTLSTTVVNNIAHASSNNIGYGWQINKAWTTNGTAQIYNIVFDSKLNKYQLFKNVGLSSSIFSIFLNKKVQYRKPPIISQGCKLLSDIGQCPTKFGKCPSKSNFEKKYIVTLYIFLLWQNPIANSFNLHFTIKLTSILAFYLTLRRNGYTYLSCDLYIYILCNVYMSDQIQVMSDEN
jgi:hypothetical protein